MVIIGYGFPILISAGAVGLIVWVLYKLIQCLAIGHREKLKAEYEDMHLFDDNSAQTIEDRLQSVYESHVRQFSDHYFKNGELDFIIESRIVPLNFECAIMGISNDVSFKNREMRKKQFGWKRCNELATDAAERCKKAFKDYLDKIDGCSYEYVHNSFVIHINKDVDDSALKNKIVNWEPKN